MKKPVLLFIVLLIAETCFGQNNLQPIRPYLSPKGEPQIYYSPRSMKSYIYENENYRETLFGQTGENNVESMCQKFHVAKDTILPAETYFNSRLNTTTGEYESFTGKYYRGDVTVYQNYENGYLKKILVYKDACGNILNLKLKGYNNDSYVQARAPRIDVDLRSKPSTSRRIEVENYIQPPKDDWSFRTPGATSEERINLNLPQTTEDPYSPPRKRIGAGWFIVPSAIIGTGILTYFVLRNNLKKSSPPPEATVNHGVDPPPDGGLGNSGNDPPP